MYRKNEKKNIETIIELLQCEMEGDVFGALAKMDYDYTMTWMYGDFRTVSIKDKKTIALMEKAYAIKGRHYEIHNMIAKDDLVFAEITESYPIKPKSKKRYSTRICFVWEFRQGKVWKGRHYCDSKPQIV